MHRWPGDNSSVGEVLTVRRGRNPRINPTASLQNGTETWAVTNAIRVPKVQKKTVRKVKYARTTKPGSCHRRGAIDAEGRPCLKARARVYGCGVRDRWDAAAPDLYLDWRGGEEKNHLC